MSHGGSLRHHLLFWLGCAALLIVLHLPYLRMPFHWDEMWQFVPSALDLYHDGAWVPHSAIPNIHPPGVMAILAGAWWLVGYSIPVSRVTMLLLAAAGLYCTYLLALRLTREPSRASAFIAVVLLAAAPMFYTQSMMVLLDMPAMVFTVLALLLFLDARYLACAIVSTGLVLMKETAITTPMVFAAWLWFGDRRRLTALYFLAPAVALVVWLVYLWSITGFWAGSADFARYNTSDSLTFFHIGYSILRRAYKLFFSDGNWIGALALIKGWRLLRGREWAVTLAVACAQIAMITIFGGAVLDRYLLPVLPILYISFAVAATAYNPARRLVSTGAMIALLVAGWFINPPFPFPYENNLAVADFVGLQRDAAEYIESNYPGQTVLSVWPFTAVIQRPELGYVRSPIKTNQLVSLHLEDIRAASPGPNDILVAYSLGPIPEGRVRKLLYMGAMATTEIDMHPEASDAELATLGYEPRRQWTSRAHWLKIYTRTIIP